MTIDDDARLSEPKLREPMFNAPVAILAVVVLLVAIHGLRLFIDPNDDAQILVDLAFIPARLAVYLDPQRLGEILQATLESAVAGEEGRRLALARFVLADNGSYWWTTLTYALLHGSWAHVLLNGAWLLAFGAPLSRRLGAVRLYLLLIVTALGGTLAHYLLHAVDITPVIGASASASGVMAAAARYSFSAFSADERERGRPALLSLGDLIRERRIMLFILVWFIVNLVFGLGAVPLGISEGGIAWEAHIGGFLAGLFLVPLVDRR